MIRSIYTFKIATRKFAEACRMRRMERCFTVTAAEVKKLRELTGAPMLDCKKALEDVEVKGDVRGAIDWLRKKGMASAGKKSGRTAADGLVCVYASHSNRQVALAEVNCETDFVARNPLFQKFSSRAAQAILQSSCANIENLQQLSLPGGDSIDNECTVEEGVKDLIAKVGENIVLRRAAIVHTDSGVVGTYVHNALADGLGKIAAAVALEAPASSERQSAVLQECARKIAMHVAAARPLYIDETDVPEEELERERNLLREQAKLSGKPENIIEKMVQGRLQKFYAESCLMHQKFLIFDGDITVKKWLALQSTAVGSDISISKFALLACGEQS